MGKITCEQRKTVQLFREEYTRITHKHSSVIKSKK